ncbi:MAG: hypothetical protein ABI277_19015 [Burkholderiaceae bacterium]
MVIRPSTLLKLFFALLLVFAQQQAVVHVLGHDFERIAHRHDSTGHSDSVCATCLAVAQLDHADAVAPMRFEPVVFQAPRFETTRHEDAPRVFSGPYHSRAPPLFS